MPPILLGKGTEEGKRIILADREVEEEYRRLLHTHRKLRRSGVPTEDHPGVLYRDILTVIREVHTRIVHLIDTLQMPQRPIR